MIPGHFDLNCTIGPVKKSTFWATPSINGHLPLWIYKITSVTRYLVQKNKTTSLEQTNFYWTYAFCLDVPSESMLNNQIYAIFWHKRQLHSLSPTFCHLSREITCNSYLKYIITGIVRLFENWTLPYSQSVDVDR